MTKTVLITGTSSGFGEAAVHRFAKEGWNVLATLRDPLKAAHLSSTQNVMTLRLDVEDRSSIESAIAQGLERFGRIDVVVNNAGYGLFGIFESAPYEAVQKQFNVNVFGAMDVVRVILPHFRKNRAGTIINVSSGAGAVGFPMASIYSSSKFALEGWSEGLWFELNSLGIKVKIIEPGGAGKTNFMARVGQEGAGLNPLEDYLPFLERTGKTYNGMQSASDPDAVEKVIAAIFEAATDGSDRLRYTPTNDIEPLLRARRSSSEDEYQAVLRSILPPQKA